MIARTEDTSYMTVGAEVDHIDVTIRRDGIIIASLRTGAWPTASIHLSPTMAAVLRDLLTSAVGAAPTVVALAEQEAST